MGAISLKHRWLAVIGFCLLVACLCSCNRQLDLREAFNKISEIERFGIEEYKSDIYRFPDSFGDATVCVHPNSSCRKKSWMCWPDFPRNGWSLRWQWMDNLSVFILHLIPHQTTCCLFISVKGVEIQC